MLIFFLFNYKNNLEIEINPFKKKIIIINVNFLVFIYINLFHFKIHLFK